MSCWFARLAGGLALAVLAGGGVPAASAQSQQRPQGRPIEFSDSKTAEVSTNLSQLGPKKNGLQQLEEELSRSLRSSPQSSLSTVPAPALFRPPAVFVAPNTRMQQALERRKNWAFATPEELMLAPSANGDSLSGLYPADDKSKPASSIERFYENLGHARDNPKANSSRDGDLADPRDRRSLHDDIDPSEEPGLPMSIKENAQQLKKLLSADPNSSVFGSISVHSSFSDFFALGDNTPTREEVEAHKAYMDKYRQVLGESSPASSLSPLNLLNPLGTARQPGAAGSLDALSTPRHEGFVSTPAGLNAILNPTAMPDQNAAVLHAWDPLYVPPKPEPPKVAPLTVPMMQVPRRQF